MRKNIILSLAISGVLIAAPFFVSARFQSKEILATVSDFIRVNLLNSKPAVDQIAQQDLGANCKEIYSGWNGLVKERVNLVFLSANFSDETSFLTKVKGLTNIYGDTNSFFSIEPYESNKDKFNFWYVNRGFNTNYAAMYQYECNIPSENRVNIYVDRNQVSALSNPYALTRTTTISGQNISDYMMLLHEFGHSFTALTDEYSGPYALAKNPQALNCGSATTESACENWCKGPPIPLETLKNEQCSNLSYGSCANAMGGNSSCAVLSDFTGADGKWGKGRSCVNAVTLCTSINDETSCNSVKNDPRDVSVCSWINNDNQVYGSQEHPYYKSRCVPTTNSFNIGTQCKAGTGCYNGCSYSRGVFRSVSDGLMQNITPGLTLGAYDEKLICDRIKADTGSVGGKCDQLFALFSSGSTPVITSTQTTTTASTSTASSQSIIQLQTQLQNLQNQLLALQTISTSSPATLEGSATTTSVTTTITSPSVYSTATSTSPTIGTTTATTTAPVSGKPDLTIYEFSLNPKKDIYYKSEPFSLSYILKNIGLKGSGQFKFSLTNKTNGQDLGGATFNSLAYGETWDQTRSWSSLYWASEGYNLIELKVDGDNIVDESNENNNVTTFGLLVSASVPPVTSTVSATTTSATTQTQSTAQTTSTNSTTQTTTPATTSSTSSSTATTTSSTSTPATPTTTTTITTPTPTPPTFTVSAPTASENIKLGQSYTIHWSSTGTVSTVRLSLYIDGGFKDFIAVDIPNSGSYQWNVPTSLPTGSAYSVRAFDFTYPNNYGDSARFTISSAGTSLNSGNSLAAVLSLAQDLINVISQQIKGLNQ